MILGVPLLYYRHVYEHSRRLRLVTDQDVVLDQGQTVRHTLYRSGQLTAGGFRDAVRRYGIKTVVNLQEEARDPMLPASMFGGDRVAESELFRELNVKYIPLDGGVLDHPDREPGSRPPVIDQFLQVIDDPAHHPILFHCKAGLHRTGLMTAIYRMEYQKRDRAAVLEELKANGFGNFAATTGNFYVDRLIMNFQRRADLLPVTPEPKVAPQP
jgi:protein tyrosine phosphatase (PTP) superfamily phosphohydrolase (DUF442 family)